MATSIASFLCLTVLTVVRSSPTECQSRIISCPCGMSNKTVQIRLNCDDQRIGKDPCAALKNCATCQDWFQLCLTCPTGKSGASCSEEIGFPAENLIRNRRQNQQCQRLESPKPGSVRCSYDSVKIECTGTCSPGHTFPDGEREKIFRCNYNTRRWSPQSSFPPCKSSGECDLEINGAGGYNCSVNNQGTFCDIRCSGFPSVAGRFYCYPGQNWSPHLPHCVKKKGVTNVPQSCNCQNGGTCDPSTLTCRCLPNYQGRLCESRIEVTNPPPRCNCQNGGTCDSVTLRCNCPSGYRGRRCQNKIEVTSPPPKCNCQNGGTCDPTTLKCRCPPDYEGRRCQNEIEPTDVEYCDNPGNIANGDREVVLLLDERLRPLRGNPPEFPEGTKLVFSCWDGYTLRGESTLRCSSGFWTPEQKPSCTASRIEEPTELEYCDNPGGIRHGHREVVPLLNERRPLPDDSPEFPEGTKMVFECDEGYVIQGENTLECESGFWSPENLPICIASATEETTELEYCDNPGRIRHGHREVVPLLNERRPLRDDSPEFPEGTKLVFECDEGYVIQGENTLECESGFWSPENLPICIASTTEGRNPEQSTYCNDPGHPENGQRYLLAEQDPKFRNSSINRYPEGIQFVFYCDDNYVLQGEDLVTCRKNGFWSSPLPVCNYESVEPTDLKYCDNPGNIANGDREVISLLDERRKPLSDDPPEFPEGTKLMYSCRNGYTLQGEEILRCGSGFWSPEQKPSCTASKTSSHGEECGLTSIGIRRKITQGDRTEEGEWPWHVGIALPDHNGWDIKCGGVLISKTAVLTAAHCLPSRPRDILLYLGKHQRSIDDSDDEVQVKTPTRLIIHPRYNISAPLDSDIAVIRFSPPAIFTDRIRPICLPDADTTRRNLTPGNKGWVTGWGVTEKRLTSEVLLKGKLPVVSNNQCRETYRQQRLSVVITNNMFCAGYEEGGVDSCEGDSGGPLMFTSDPDQSYVLEGLVSFGSPAACGQPRHYTIYTKVGNYIDWIKENI